MIYEINELFYPDNPKILVTTGGFDPIHQGHLDLLEEFEKIPADMRIVGLNSDSWLKKKKGAAFLDFETRRRILLKLLGKNTMVWKMDDSNGDSCDFLREIKIEYPDAHIIFIKGGDRTAENIPEMKVEGIDFAFGCGGGENSKVQSSSRLLEEYFINCNWVKRNWGQYRVLAEHLPRCENESKTRVKLKILSIEPGQYLSMQRHQYRSEFWFAADNSFVVNYDDGYGRTIRQGSSATIGPNTWHQLGNPDLMHACDIIEIQYGEKCEEEDIERK